MFCEPSGFETGLATNPKGWSWRQLFLSARSRFSAAMSVTAQLWALAFFWCQTCAHSHRFRQPGGNSQFAAGTKGRRSKFQHVQGVLLVDKLAVRSRNQKGEGVIPAASRKDCRTLSMFRVLFPFTTSLPCCRHLSLVQLRWNNLGVVRLGNPPMEPSLAHQCSLVGEDLRQKQDEQQLKKFTRWWNSWLKVRGIPVTDLCERSRTASSA